MDITYHNKIAALEYNDMRKCVGWRELSERQARECIMNCSYIVVAVDNDVKVGLARVVSDGGYVYHISDVIVRPEYQGKGIGGELMHRVMRYIRSNIKEGEQAYVNLMSAKGKETFYSKFGFLERPSTDYGAGMSQFIDIEEA